MPFSVQNDQGTIVGANSYNTVAAFIEYFSDRGVDATEYENENIESSLVQATDYIDFTFKFKLSKTLETQDTEWPRGTIGIPTDIKKACNEYAKLILDGVSLSPEFDYDSTGQNIKSKKEKVGSLEESVTYKDDYQMQLVRSYPKADKYLRNYIIDSSVVYKQRA